MSSYSGIQRLCRAAWSLAARGGTDCASQLRHELLTSAQIGLIPSQAAPVPTIAKLVQSWSSPALFSSVRAFHAAAPLLDEQPTINPLQQAPPPAAADRQPAELDNEAGPGSSEAGYARAISRNLSISPQKLNMFAKVLRGLHLEDALIQCKMHPKKAAAMCHKTLLSAQANATHNHALAGDRLLVDQMWVGKGVYLKRTSLHGRGRSGKMQKYRSHLTVVLKEGTVPRRTRIIPMVQERKKWWDMREGRERDGQQPGWRWWPRKPVPPGAMKGRARREQIDVTESA